MLNSIATGLAPRLSLPTGAPALTAPAGRAAALHGLPGLQLPMLGNNLGGYRRRHVQFDPEPGEKRQQRQAGLPSRLWEIHVFLFHVLVGRR